MKYPTTHGTFTNMVTYQNHYSTPTLKRCRNSEFCFKDTSDICLYKSKREEWNKQKRDGA